MSKMDDMLGWLILLLVNTSVIFQTYSNKTRVVLRWMKGRGPKNTSDKDWLEN